MAEYALLIIQMCLQLDVVSTIQTPLQRGATLRILVNLMWLGIFVSAIVCIASIPYTLKQINENTMVHSLDLSDPVTTSYSNSISIDITVYRIYNSFYSSGVKIAYVLITFYCLFILTIGFLRNLSYQRTQKRECRKPKYAP